MRKVRSGYGWRPRSAADENAIADAAGAYQLGALGRSQNRPQGPAAATPGLARVYNNSVHAIAAGDALGLGLGTKIDAAEFAGATTNAMNWAQNLIFYSRRPIYADLGKFAIALEPIPTLKYGWAVSDGLAVAQLDIVHADHPFADITANSYRLTSNWYGAAKILYSEEVSFAPDPSEWWGVVRLGHFQSPPYLAKIDDGQALTPGGAAVCQIWKYDSGFSDTGETVNARDWMLNAGESLTAGEKCFVQFIHTVNTWVVTSPADIPP